MPSKNEMDSALVGLKVLIPNKGLAILTLTEKIYFKYTGFSIEREVYESG